MRIKSEVVEFVERQVELGRKAGDVLESLQVSRSTYYSWKKGPKEPVSPAVKNANRRLTPAEKQIVLKAKEENPQCRHRQIQGYSKCRRLYLAMRISFGSLMIKAKLTFS